MVKIDENLWTLYPKKTIESINWIKSKKLFDTLNRMNTRKFSNDIKDAMSRLGFNDVILFNDSSMFLGQYLKEFLNPTMYIYYMRDYLTKNPYWKKTWRKT